MDKFVPSVQSILTSHRVEEAPLAMIQTAAQILHVIPECEQKRLQLSFIEQASTSDTPNDHNHWLLCCAAALIMSSLQSKEGKEKDENGVQENFISTFENFLLCALEVRESVTTAGDVHPTMSDDDGQASIDAACIAIAYCYPHYCGSIVQGACSLLTYEDSTARNKSHLNFGSSVAIITAIAQRISNLPSSAEIVKEECHLIDVALKHLSTTLLMQESLKEKKVQQQVSSSEEGGKEKEGSGRVKTVSGSKTSRMLMDEGIEDSLSLLTRKILLPLLLSQVRRAKEGEKNVDVSATKEALKHHRAKVLNLIHSFTVAGQPWEAVILFAALFDFFFTDQSEEMENDLRKDNLLWEAVTASLSVRTLTKKLGGEEVAKRTNMQNQAIYLLKRIVEYTELQYPSRHGKERAVHNDDVGKAAAKGGSKKQKGSLKEGEKAQQKVLLLPFQQVEFHPLFRWNNENGYQQWQIFFMIYEVLTEYSIHLVVTTFSKIHSLIGDDKGCSDDLLFEPKWIELIVQKAIAHPNVGCRKMVLQFFWSLPMKTIHRLFPMSFICDEVFVAAGDPKLCGEADRIVLPTDHKDFLDGKSSLGNDEMLLPKVLPTVVRAEEFFAEYLSELIVVSGNQSNSLKESSGHSILQSAFVTMLKGLRGKQSSRFGLALNLRVLKYCAENILRGNETMDLFHQNAEFIHTILHIVTELMQDSHPLWIEVRFYAILVDFICAVIAACPTTSSCLLQQQGVDDVLQLFGALTKNGCCGGKGASAIDNIGIAGETGSALPHDLFLKRCCCYEAEGKTKQHCKNNFKQNLSTLIDRNHLNAVNFIKACGQKDAEHVEFTVIKRNSLLIALQPDENQFRELQHVLNEHLLSLSERSTLPIVTQLNYLMLFTEFSSALNRENDEGERDSNDDQSIIDAHKNFVIQRMQFPQATLTQLFEFTSALALDGLRKAVAELRKNVATGGTMKEYSSSSIWMLHQTEHWDVLCAAMCTIFQLTVRLYATTTEKFEDLEFALKNYQVQNFLDALLHLLDEMFDVQISLLDQKQEIESGGSCSVANGKMILLRNCARLIQAVLSTVAANPAIFESRSSKSFHFELSFVEKTIEILLKVKSIHFNACDVRSQLTSLTWGIVIEQHYRAIWNSVLLLCRTLHIRELFDDEKQQGEIAAFARKLFQNSMLELDLCGSSNFSSVYDVMFWVVSNGALVASTLSEGDYVDMLQLMLSHADNGLKREVLRCTPILAFSIAVVPLKYLSVVKQKVFDPWIEREGLTDRVIYFLSTGASLSALQSKEHFLVWLDTLLYLAILMNTSYVDEESEALVACCDRITHAWPMAFEMSYFPSLRMENIARCTAISTILHWCSKSRGNDCKFSSFSLLWKLLEWNLSHRVITHEPCMPNSTTHRCRIRLWQLICALTPIITDLQSWTALLTFVLGQVICVSNTGSVRRYMELFVIAGVTRYPKELTPLLISAMNAECASRPQVQASFALTLVHVLLRCGLPASITALEGETEEGEAKYHNVSLLYEHFPILVKLVASHQFLLRVISGIGIDAILRQLEKIDPQNQIFSKDILELSRYLRHHPEVIKQREKHVAVVLFDSAASITPHELFCVQRKETDSWLLDSVPDSIFERTRFVDGELNSAWSAISIFEKYRAHVLMEGTNALALTQCFQSLPLIPHSRHVQDRYLDYSYECLFQLQPIGASRSNTGDQGEGKENVQRKVTPWWNSEVHNELHPRALGIRQRQSCVVVTTLLDNPVNVAGLFRCGEIFAIEGIVVTDRAVFQHPHFIAAARSAELWTPWEEINQPKLPEYLNRMRLQGYTIVGIEQTAQSENLTEFSFPSKVVIVLGSEGRGMDASIIPLMDVCVEIPQYGLIRSFNVHVSGAIVLYEYTRQRQQHASMKQGESPK